MREREVVAGRLLPSAYPDPTTPRKTPAYPGRRNSF
nr:unnamed protein product [Digitaria exilis]